MAEIVYPEDGNELNDQQRFESYQKNKELHFLQMRNNLRNSFMTYNQKRTMDNTLSKSKSGISHGNPVQIDRSYGQQPEIEMSTDVKNMSQALADLSRQGDSSLREKYQLAETTDGMTGSRSKSNYKPGGNPQLKRDRTADHNESVSISRQQTGRQASRQQLTNDGKMTSSIMRKYKSIENIKRTDKSKLESRGFEAREDKYEDKKFRVPRPNSKLSAKKTVSTFVAHNKPLDIDSKPRFVNKKSEQLLQQTLRAKLKVEEFLLKKGQESQSKKQLEEVRTRGTFTPHITTKARNLKRTGDVFERLYSTRKNGADRLPTENESETPSAQQYLENDLIREQLNIDRKMTAHENCGSTASLGNSHEQKLRSVAQNRRQKNY